MSSPPRLVLMDWGIGGFGAYALLRELCPLLDVVYVSDSGFVPYGRVERSVLRARLEWVCAVTGAEELLVACNAACSALEPWVEGGERGGLPVRWAGVLRAGVEATREVVGGLGVGRRARVGVVGGYATVRSGVYERLLLSSGVEVVSRVAQPISAHVEAGRLSGEGLLGDVRAVCEALGAVDVVALACTHYPAVLGVWRGFLPGVPLVDPAVRFVGEVVEGWGLRGRGGSGGLEVWTTGDPGELRRGAWAAWGVRVGEVRLLPSEGQGV